MDWEDYYTSLKTHHVSEGGGVGDSHQLMWIVCSHPLPGDSFGAPVHTYVLLLVGLVFWT